MNEMEITIMCEMKKMEESKIDRGRTFLENKKIDNTIVPLWQVDDLYSLIKLIGHAKYINRDYGSVLLRGQDAEYGSMKPSAYRIARSKQQADKKVMDMIKKIERDNEQKNIASFVNPPKDNAAEAYEAILQHYGYKTRFIDVVDNMWTALWFASHTRRTENNEKHYEIENYTENTAASSYFYLFGVPQAVNNSGIEKDEKHCLVDIRRACPSTILRPHMQHAMALCFYSETGEIMESYAEQLIAIVKLETAKVLQWIGKDNETLTSRILFPSLENDQLYHLICDERKDFFKQLR